MLIHHEGAHTFYGPMLSEKNEMIGELAQFEKEVYGKNPKIKGINADRYRRYYYKAFKRAVEVSKKLETDVMKLI